MVVAFGVELGHGGQDEWAEEGEADLASVGVTGEDEVDEWGAGVFQDIFYVVWLVGHEDDGAVGADGDGEVEVGVAGAGVFDAAEPEAGAVALDGDVLVDEDWGAVFLEGVDDEGGAYSYVMVAEDGVAERGGEGGEDLGAAVGGVVGGDEGEGSEGDEVSGDEDEVGREGVDVFDDAVEEVGLGVLVDVDIAYLDDAVAVEGGGKVADGDGTLDDVDLVAADFAGVEGDACGGDSGADEESAAGDFGGGVACAFGLWVAGDSRGWVGEKHRHIS